MIIEITENKIIKENAWYEQRLIAMYKYEKLIVNLELNNKENNL